MLTTSANMDFLDGLSRSDVFLVQSLIDRNCQDNVIRSVLDDDVRFNQYIQHKKYNKIVEGLSPDIKKSIEKLISIDACDEGISAFLDNSRMELYRKWKYCSNEFEDINMIRLEASVVHIEMVVDAPFLSLVTNTHRQMDRGEVELITYPSDSEGFIRIRLSGNKEKVTSASESIIDELMKSSAMKKQMVTMGKDYNDLSSKQKVEKLIRKFGPFMQFRIPSEGIFSMKGHNHLNQEETVMYVNADKCLDITGVGINVESHTVTSVTERKNIDNKEENKKEEQIRIERTRKIKRELGGSLDRIDEVGETVSDCGRVTREVTRTSERQKRSSSVYDRSTSNSRNNNNNSGGPIVVNVNTGKPVRPQSSRNPRSFMQ